MHRPIVLLLTAALALAGCLATPTEDVSPEAVEDAAAAAPPAVPEAIEDTQMVVASLDPLNFVTMQVCETPTAQCFDYPFTLEGETKLDAALTWGVPANDLDLYVMDAQGTRLLAESGASAPPGNTESVAGTLEAGEYTLLVVAWAAVGETFTVAATFEPVVVAEATLADDASNTTASR